MLKIHENESQIDSFQVVIATKCNNDMLATLVELLSTQINSCPANCSPFIRLIQSQDDCTAKSLHFTHFKGNQVNTEGVSYVVTAIFELVGIKGLKEHCRLLDVLYPSNTAMLCIMLSQKRGGANSCTMSYYYTYR